MIKKCTKCNEAIDITVKSYDAFREIFLSCHMMTTVHDRITKSFQSNLLSKDIVFVFFVDSPAPEF